MFEKTKKNLIHFETSGSIAEDFLNSRREKSLRLRAAAKALFCVHAAAMMIGAVLGFVLGKGAFTLIVSAGAVLGLVLSIMGLGELTRGVMAAKAVNFIADFLIALGELCGAFIFKEHKTLMLAGGAVMFVGGAAALAGFIVCYFRKYLQGISPRDITDEDYEKLPGFHDEKEPKKNEITVQKTAIIEEEEELPVIEEVSVEDNAELFEPPPLSEMQELAFRLGRILTKSAPRPVSITQEIIIPDTEDVYDETDAEERRTSF